MTKTLEQKFDEMQSKRMDLIFKKYNAGGLDENEHKRLRRLHSQVEKMAPKISSYMLKKAATGPQILIVVKDRNEK